MLFSSPRIEVAHAQYRSAAHRGDFADVQWKELPIRPTILIGIPSKEEARNPVIRNRKIEYI